MQFTTNLLIVITGAMAAFWSSVQLQSVFYGAVNFNAYIFVYITWWLMFTLGLLELWLGGVDPGSSLGLNVYWFYWTTFAG